MKPGNLFFRVLIIFFNEFHLKICFFSKKMKEFRSAIIRMHERGKGVREIARDLGISPNTVS